MSTTISPLAPASFPHLPPVAGVELATMAAGLRYQGRDDLFLAVVPAGTTVAGVFTTSRCPSAPVDWCRKHLSRGEARAVVVNAGNANAFTGSAGYAVSVATARAAAAALGVEPESVFLSSTGVIGEQMSEPAITAAIPRLVAGRVPADAGAWEAAAHAICTTDTFAKGSASPVGTTGARVVGIAKGSGMIAPDMATMLAYVFTDAAVSADRLQRLTTAAVTRSFNRITVDGDTSTSDTVLVFATGCSDTEIDDANEATLADALEAVMLDLAQQIVCDGEGATKFISVEVTGAQSTRAAERIARSIAESPLVKTAIAAEDANWGRIVMAVGKAGEAADRDRLRIKIGDELVASDGVKHPDYSEERATRHLGQPHVEISVDVGVGTDTATVWTCDLTHGYIDINAGYRS